MRHFGCLQTFKEQGTPLMALAGSRVHLSRLCPFNRELCWAAATLKGLLFPLLNFLSLQVASPALLISLPSPFLRSCRDNVVISRFHSSSGCLEILLVVHLVPYSSSGIFDTNLNGTVIFHPLCHLDFWFSVSQSGIWPTL